MALDALGQAQGLSGNQKLATALGMVLSMPECAASQISLHVEQLDGKRTVGFTHNTELALNPASNSKLATATYALGVLGPEHQFKTQVLADSTGNVFIKGGFDPSLTYADLVTMAKELRSKGVQEVRGDLVLDNSALVGSRVPKHFAEFGDEDWDYLARPEPLSVNKNLMELMVQPGRNPGDAAMVRSPVACFEVAAAVTTVAPGTRFRVGCDEQDTAGTLIRNLKGQAIIDVTGTIAADYTKGKVLKMKSPAPQESGADRVAAAFAEAGIVVGGGIRQGTAPADATLLHAHHSAPLADLVQVSISTSNAFDHEMYCLAASAAQSPDGRTTIAQATDRMTRFLSSEVGLEDFRMDNASGLGDANRLSGGDMVALLRNAWQDRRYGALLNGLAQPGQTGTLKSRLLDTPAETSVRAKTGTLRNAIALSGTVNGRMAFSVLINGQGEASLPRTAARAVVDAVGIVLASV